MMSDLPTPKKPLDFSDRPKGHRRKWTEDRLDELEEAFWDWIDSDNQILLGEFCLKHRISQSELKRFCERHPGMAEAHEMAKLKQQTALCKGGLTNRFNTRLTMFLLTVQHGMVEKTGVEHSGQVTTQPVLFNEQAKPWNNAQSA